MRIAVLGTGSVGGALGSRWAAAGHEVVFGSRDPSQPKPQALIARCEGRATATSFAEAAARADSVLLAVPWSNTQATLKSLGDLSGKILIDCSNPLRADFSGLELGHSTSAAEQIAEWAPAARVVKAFNTVSVKVMLDPTFAAEPATLFFCGDDTAAKEVVRGLSADLGFHPVDAGPLASARYLEPLAMLYIHLAFKQGWGSNCAFKIMKR
jgi:NADPH-dependent F420 reductase